MTILSAAIYFDERGRPAGYVLGSDSNVRFSSLDNVVIQETETEKAFFGTNFVGIASSTYYAASCDEFNPRIRELGDVFEGIGWGTDFSEDDRLHAYLYDVLIAKENDENIDLLRVTNREGPYNQKHRAELFHRINYVMSTDQEQLLWLGPSLEGYLKIT